MLQFIMTNLFGIGVVFAYFGIEGFIANAMNGQTLVVPAIFVLCFLIVLIVESFLDDYLSNEIKKNNNIDISNKGLYGKNKTLLMLIMRNVGGGGSLSMKFSELLIEDAIDDIYEILHISSHVDESVKKKIITKINSRRSAKEMKSNNR